MREEKKQIVAKVGEKMHISSAFLRICSHTNNVYRTGKAEIQHMVYDVSKGAGLFYGETVILQCGCNVGTEERNKLQAARAVWQKKG